MRVKIFALQTARAGSKSVPNKNIKIIDKKPLFYHNVSECEKNQLIKKIFISTDCDYIKNYNMSSKVQIIDRPKNLCLDYSSHKEVMKHAILEIEKQTKNKVDLILVLLGNSCGMKSEDISNAYKIIKENPSIDSVESVSKFNMFNPFRAMKIIDNKVETFLDEKEILENKRSNLINDKGSAGDIYFFNGSFWLTRRRNIFSKTGKLPYQWLGENVYPYIQETCMEIDDTWQLEFLKSKFANKE